MTHLQFDKNIRVFRVIFHHHILCTNTHAEWLYIYKNLMNTLYSQFSQKKSQRLHYLTIASGKANLDVTLGKLFSAAHLCNAVSRDTILKRVGSQFSSKIGII